MRICKRNFVFRLLKKNVLDSRFQITAKKGTKVTYVFKFNDCSKKNNFLSL